MKAVIFLGPTLPLGEARSILEAIYLPPARQSDFLTAAVNHRPDVIGLIDGVFLHSLSVWHKEILYALRTGIRVYGSSSMGALRAAETAQFGMIGVGEVYRQYASGELMDDDEVALAHASPEQNYLKVSEAMVNVRATFAAAQTAGLIDDAQLRRLNEIAKAMYFPERAFPAILRAAQAEGFPKITLEALSEFVKTGFVDVKKQDAIALLTTIRDLPPIELKAKAQEKTFDFGRTSSFATTLYNRDRRVEHDGVSLPLEAIGNYVALHDPEFNDLNFNALNRAIAYEFAELLGVEVTDQDVEAECARFRRKRELSGEEGLSTWLQANHLSAEEFRHLMSQVAHCRRLHRWFLYAMWMDRTTKLNLDELRLKGTYPEWVARAAAQELLLEGQDQHAERTWNSLEELAAEHREWTDCNIDLDAVAWAEEAGFHTDGNLKMELSRAKTARLAVLRMLADAAPSEERSGDPADQTTAPAQPR